MGISKQLAYSIIIFISGLSAAQASDGQTYHLSDGTRNRTYLLHRPVQLSRQSPVPLVIMLHGGFGSGSQAQNSYGWDEQADRQGFVVAYPDGIGHSWNAGGICCGPALRKNIDDLGFLSRLIDAVSKSENIDPRRVYLAGMSNGAAMAYRYACEGTYPVAAIGPVSGSFSYTCAKPHPVSVIAIHGLDDQHVPFAGGSGTKGVTNGSWMSVPQSLDAIRSANHCQPATTKNEGLLHMETSNCEQGREVVLYTIEGAGHQWPGGKAKKGLVQRILGADQPSTAMDATPALWDFFQRHLARQ